MEPDAIKNDPISCPSGNCNSGNDVITPSPGSQSFQGGLVTATAPTGGGVWFDQDPTFGGVGVGLLSQGSDADQIGPGELTNAALHYAAELLRATATQSAAEKTEQAIVVPPVLAFPKSRREKNARQAVLSSRDVPPSKAVEDLHAACKRLTTAEPHHKKKDQPPESAIAMRILELHDRFGGLIK